jgi:hypothetical protein
VVAGGESVRTIPEFCPGCGARFLNGLGARVPLSAASGTRLEAGRFKDPTPVWGWDCWCPTCGWSGDISPDEQNRRAG